MLCATTPHVCTVTAAHALNPPACTPSAPADFAKGKMFGAKALKAGMLQHSKDAIPTSLTKLAPDAQVLSGRVMMIN